MPRSNDEAYVSAPGLSITSGPHRTGLGQWNAEETRKQLSELGDLAGFHVGKWISNEPEVIADVAEEDRTSAIDLEKRELPITKTLGVPWAAAADEFFFRH